MRLHLYWLRPVLLKASFLSAVFLRDVSLKRHGVKKPPFLLFFLPFFSFLSFLSMSFSAFAQIEIQSGYVLEPINNSKATAAYLDLINTNNKDMTLVSVSSEKTNKIEIHHHVHKAGMMKMEKKDKLTIAANTQESFKPGGLHLMLFDLDTKPTKENEITLTFSFSNGEKIQSTFPIRRLQDTLLTQNGQFDKKHHK